MEVQRYDGWTWSEFCVIISSTSLRKHKHLVICKISGQN